MKKGKILSLVMVLCMLITCISVAGMTSVSAVSTDKVESAAAVDTEATSANPYGLADSVDDGMILQAWNWSYKNAEAQLENVANAGFTTIQISPPNEIKEGTLGHQVIEGDNTKNGWWMFYQPAGFQLNESTDNALGTKSELLSLIEKAHSMGIRVIADAVINHMGTCDNETSVNSSNPMDHLTSRAVQFEPEIVNNQLFHKPWVEMTYKENYWDGYSDRDIEEDLTQHCTSRLPDLDTSNQIVQDAIYDYFVELIDAGIDGLRIDAAKHIETPSDTYFGSDFWDDTLVKAQAYAKNTYSKDFFAYGEILNKCGDGRPYSEYFKYMEITDTSVYYSIANNVNSGNASAAIPQNMVNGTKAQTILWSESHDSYMDGSTRNTSLTDLNKRWACEASRDGITSMYFARPQSLSQQLGVASETGWTSDVVKAVNDFSNYYNGSGEYLESGSSVAVIGRGDKASGGGAVLVNCSGTSKSVSGLATHTLGDGSYVDKVSGNAFTVSGGKVSGSIGSTGVAVLYDVSNSPMITASNAGGNYTADTISVTFGYKNATSGYYQINGGAQVPFVDTATVTIGEGVGFDETTTVYVYAANDDGEYASKTYTYTKVDGSTLYLDGGVWDTANAWFAAYFFEGTTANEWVPLAKGASGYYECTVPDGYSNVIFTRQNPASKVASWENKWDQSPDLTFDGNLYTVTDWAAGSWSTYQPPTTPTTPTTPSSATIPTTPSSATVPSSSETTPSSSPVTYIVGDANLDGVINVKDVTTIQKHSAKIEEISGKALDAADVNNDGEANIKDATEIQKYLADLGSDYNIGQETFG